MNNEDVKKEASKENGSSSDNQDSSEQALPIHNPLKEGDDKEITQEDVDNEQKFKEALTERD